MFGLNQNLRFNAQLGFRQNKYNSEDIKFVQNNIFVPLYLSYVFRNKKVVPFINFGINNVFSLSSKSDLNWSGSWDNILGFYQISFLTGVGCEISRNNKDIFFMINYELGSGINGFGIDTNYFITSVTHGIGINVGLKYKLH